MAGLPFSAGSCVLSMCGQFGVWSWQSLVCGKVVELCCTNSLLDLDVFRKVCFWFRCSRVPAMLCKCTYLLWVRPTDLRVCGQARCQGRFCKSVSFFISRNANMRRDPCYDQLGLRWYLFKKVVKAFHIFSFKSLVPQALDCGQAVCINNKSLILW